MATYLDGLEGGKHNSDNSEVSFSPKTLGYKPRRETMIQHLIEYQINLAGYTMVDTFNDDRWHRKWTLTVAQKKEFQKYSKGIIKKVFRCNSAKAQNTFEWFYSVFGLKIKDV